MILITISYDGNKQYIYQYHCLVAIDKPLADVTLTYRLKPTAFLYSEHVCCAFYTKVLTINPVIFSTSHT